MNKRAELKQLYKEMKIEAGVYQIKNRINGKILVESTLNLKTMNGRRMEMGTGSHPNKSLERELKEFGPDAFVLEVLEVLKIREESSFNAKNALKELAEKWLEKLQPYGERGYNAVRKQA